MEKPNLVEVSPKVSKVLNRVEASRNRSPLRVNELMLVSRKLLRVNALAA